MTRVLARMLLTTLVATAGCTVMYADDADRKQCKSNDDCEKRSGGEGLVCKLPEGVCGDPEGSDEPVACKQNTDCPDAQLCGFNGFCYEKWGCLDSDLDWPEANRDFTFTAPLVSLTNPENPDLLGDAFEVLACAGADPGCASPIATGNVDADKLLSLRFSNFTGSQFTGSIRIRDSAATEPESAAFMPTYVHYGSESRLVTSLRVQTRIFLVNPATYAMLATLAGVSNADQGAGTVIFIVHDCGGQLAAAVSMRPESTSSWEFLAVSGGNQPVPGTNATTEDGAGLLLNIPPDEARTFVLTDEASGDEIDRVSLNVRGRAINYVFYYPRYAALDQWLEEYSQLENEDG
jgi:hypothetical protein